MTKYLTAREVASMLQVGVPTLDRWKKSRGFPHEVHLKGLKYRVWATADIEQWRKETIAKWAPRPRKSLALATNFWLTR